MIFFSFNEKFQSLVQMVVFKLQNYFSIEGCFCPDISMYITPKNFENLMEKNICLI